MSVTSSRFLVHPRDTNTPDVTVRVQRAPRLSQPTGDMLFDSGGTWRMYQEHDDFVFSFVSTALGTAPYRLARFDTSFTRGMISFNGDCVPDSAALVPLEFPLDELMMINLLARGRGVEVHGCGVIDRDGTAYLFAGHSEAGKSTSARLWHREGATVLSDDRVVLRLREDRVWMYGAPWHGEEESGFPRRRRSRGSSSSPTAARMPCILRAARAPPRDSSPAAFLRFTITRAWTSRSVSSGASSIACRASTQLPARPDRRQFRTKPNMTSIPVASGFSRTFMRVLESLLSGGHPVRFRAPGWSMYPTIRDGDAITVVPLGRSPVRVGDVVLYRRGTAAIAHRVIRVRPAGFVMRGDAAHTCDGPIEPAQVLGRVSAIERNGGARSTSTVWGRPGLGPSHMRCGSRARSGAQQPGPSAACPKKVL